MDYMLSIDLIDVVTSKNTTRDTTKAFNQGAGHILIQTRTCTTDCWPHFHLSADTGESSSSIIMGDVWSVCRVPSRYLYRPELPLQINMVSKFLMMMDWYYSHTTAENSSNGDQTSAARVHGSGTIYYSNESN